jgi:flagellar biosynthesis protein FlhG
MKTIAFTGGKGGVGKTSLACNISIALARQEKRVILLDADFGLANADTLFGVRPDYTLKDIFDGHPIQDVVTKTPYGVSLLAGASGVAELADLPASKLAILVDQLGKLEHGFDTMIIDTAAGISESVMALLTVSDQVVLVVTPDPLSILDAYATIKVLSARRANLDIRVILNMVESEEEAKRLFAKIRSVAVDSLGVRMHYVGYVRRALAFRKSLCSRQPLISGEHRSAATGDIIACATYWREGRPSDEETAKPFFSRLASLFRDRDLIGSGR